MIVHDKSQPLRPGLVGNGEVVLEDGDGQEFQSVEVDDRNIRNGVPRGRQLG